ncbi:MAG: hypothetical protein ACUVSF_11655 [Anaerolineae bacterium]
MSLCGLAAVCAAGASEALVLNLKRPARLLTGVSLRGRPGR